MLDNFDIYKDISERTQGDIYVGVVGPVRTGKSTFIKRFMDLMVIPNIENSYKKERAKDELPQSGSGKSIHTTEPKFVPNEAVEINLKDGIKFKVRMVDCVGYIVKGAEGYKEGEKDKMVSTPWYDHEIPFEKAAEIGTKKVINEHSTIGLLVTTDGSITDLKREDYLETEERVINELKAINKPFIIILNSAHPDDENTIEIAKGLEEKHDVPVQVVDVLNMQENDIAEVFRRVLKEFPVKEINIDMPSWIEKLNPKHWLKSSYFELIKSICGGVNKARDIKKTLDTFANVDFLDNLNTPEINMGDGTAHVVLNPKSGIFYKILSEICNAEISSESELLSTMAEYHKAKLNMTELKML